VDETFVRVKLRLGSVLLFYLLVRPDVYAPHHQGFAGSAEHRPSITGAVVDTLLCAIAGAVAIPDTGSNRDVHADLDSSRAARALLVRRGQHTEWGIREYILITLANLYE